MNIRQSIEGLNRTKRQRNGKFGLELGHPSPGLGLWCAPLAPLALRPSGLDWSYTTCFPASLAGSWQIVELLGLHNLVRQSLIIISLYISVYILLVHFLQRSLIQLGSFSFKISSTLRKITTYTASSKYQ